MKEVFHFSYNNLVSDMRSIPIMQKTGYPVIFDATHSFNNQADLEKNQEEKRVRSILARAAVAVGVAVYF